MSPKDHKGISKEIWIFTLLLYLFLGRTWNLFCWQHFKRQECFSEKENGRNKWKSLGKSMHEKGLCLGGWKQKSASLKTGPPPKKKRKKNKLRRISFLFPCPLHLDINLYLISISSSLGQVFIIFSSGYSKNFLSSFFYFSVSILNLCRRRWPPKDRLWGLLPRKTQRLLFSLFILKLKSLQICSKLTF